MLEKAEEALAVNINPESFTDALKREEERVNNQLRRFKAERTEMEEKLNDTIDELKQKRATLEEKKKRGQTDLMESKSQIAKIRREMSELEGAGDILKKLKEEWETKNNELIRAKEDVDLDSLQNSIKLKKAELQEAEMVEEGLKEELGTLEEAQHTLQQIEYLNKDIKSKEEKRKKIANKRNSTFLDLFQTIPDSKRLKSVYKGEQEKNEKLVKDIESQKQKEETAITLKSDQMAQIKKERAKRVKKERDLQSRVSDVLVGDEDLESELSNSRDKLDTLRKELQLKEAGKFTYKEFLDRMNRMEEPACPTCNRGFHDLSESEELKRDLEAMIAEIPRKLQGLEKKVNMEEKRHQELLNISPDYHALKQTRQEIQEFTSQVSNIEKELKAMKERKEEKEEEWGKVMETSETLRSVAEDVQMIDTITRELTGLLERRDDLQLTCPPLSDDRGLEIVRKEEKELTTKLRRLRKECDAEQDSYNFNSKMLNDLEASCNKLTNRKLEIEGKQQQRANMLEKRGEIEARVISIQKEIEANVEELKPLKEQVDAKEAEKTEFLHEKERELDRFHAKEKTVERMKRDLEKLDHHIQQFQNSNKGHNLEMAKQKKLEYEQDLQGIREQRAEDEQEHQRVSREIDNMDSVKRNLKDNLKLRKLKEDERNQLREMEKYRVKLDNTDFNLVETKKKKMVQQMNDIHAEINSKNGKLSEMKRSILEIERELNNPKLKNAARLV